MGPFLSFAANYRKSHLILLKFCRLKVRFLVLHPPPRQFFYFLFFKKTQLHQDKQKSCGFGIEVDGVIILYPSAELSSAHVGGLLEGFQVAGSWQDFPVPSGIQCLTLRGEKTRGIEKWGRARSSMGEMGPRKTRQ